MENLGGSPVLHKSGASMFAAPALAAKHAKAAKIKMTGACAQQSGRCISDCD
jgi:hypothetical protein